MKTRHQKSLLLLYIALNTHNIHSALATHQESDTSRMGIVELAQHILENRLNGPTEITAEYEKVLARVVQESRAREGQRIFERDAQLFGFRQKSYLTSGNINPMCIPELFRKINEFLGIKSLKSLPCPEYQCTNKNTLWKNTKYNEYLVAYNIEYLERDNKQAGSISIYNGISRELCYRRTSENLITTGTYPIKEMTSLPHKKSTPLNPLYNSRITFIDNRGVKTQITYHKTKPGNWKHIKTGDNTCQLIKITGLEKDDDTPMPQLVALYSLQEIIRKAHGITIHQTDPLWRSLSMQQKKDFKKLLGSRFVPAPKDSSAAINPKNTHMPVIDTTPRMTSSSRSSKKRKRTYTNLRFARQLF